MWSLWVLGYIVYSQGLSLSDTPDSVTLWIPILSVSFCDFMFRRPEAFKSWSLQGEVNCARHNDSQGLPLVLCSGIASGGAQGTIGGARVQTWIDC